MADNVFYLALKVVYLNKTYTHTESGAKDSLFQFGLTITKPFSPLYLEDVKNY